MVLTLRHLRDLWGDPNFCGCTDLNLDEPLGPVCTDSRKLTKGSLYIPLQGDNFDGHNFLHEVAQRDPQATIVSKTACVDIPSGLIYWIVDDTLKAYQQLALLHRNLLDIPVVAVTGSTGKTTTRELIKASLLSLGNIVASVDNNNNDIGVPLTLLSADKTHKALVVEMGMRGLGQIHRLSRYTEPDIAVITNIGSAHIGLLGTRQNIAKAKCEVTSFLKPAGLVVIPAGEPLLESELKKKWNGRVLRVALQDQASLPVSNYNDLYSQGLPNADLIGDVLLDQCILNLDGQSYQLPLEGRHNALNFLFAIAVARELGVGLSNLKQIKTSLPAGRHKCIKIAGINYIDETYNASPESVIASLNLLVTKPGRHFAVLGRMFELGEQSMALHKKVANHVAALELDGLVIVADGPEANEMVKEAKSINNLAVVSSPEDAVVPLNNWLVSGDNVLFKGSRAVALERLLRLLRVRET